MKTYKPMAGDCISNAAGEAAKLAHGYNETVEFEFNDVYIHVWPDDKPKAITNLYYLVINGVNWNRRGKKHIYSLHDSPHLPDDLFTI